MTLTTSMTRIAVILLIANSLANAQTVLEGFERSSHLDEQVRTFTVDPGIEVHINAPAADGYDPTKQIRLVLFALPNGNTIEQTVGKKLKPGMDWHFDIQHIGAQIRLLRQSVNDSNIVVAYLANDKLSWPAWRKGHEDAGQIILRLITSLRNEFGGADVRVELASHSGGGSLIFALIDHVDQIPYWITRIVFLDSNYGYRDDSDQPAKLTRWLSDSEGRLFVSAYDDREVTLNGKRIVGPNGGTYRRTLEMVDRFSRDQSATESETKDYRRVRFFDNRAEFNLLHNPDNKILHTVMVERNGLIHALTFGTDLEGEVGIFFGDRAYGDWIQAD